MIDDSLLILFGWAVIHATPGRVSTCEFLSEYYAYTYNTVQCIPYSYSLGTNQRREKGTLPAYLGDLTAIKRAGKSPTFSRFFL